MARHFHFQRKIFGFGDDFVRFGAETKRKEKERKN
jgi:hypothetical protein